MAFRMRPTASKSSELLESLQPVLSYPDRSLRPTLFGLDDFCQSFLTGCMYGVLHDTEWGSLAQGCLPYVGVVGVVVGAGGLEPTNSGNADW